MKRILAIIWLAIVAIAFVGVIFWASWIFGLVLFGSFALLGITMVAIETLDD